MYPDNPEVQAGDIWLWCGRDHVLVLRRDEDDGCWVALNLTSGKIGNWTLAVDDEVEGEDWEWIA